VQRFENTGDVWEQIGCRQNGWEYDVTPADLMRRWALY
jgi:hypothetical protein